MSTTLTSSGYEVVHSHDDIPFWTAGSASILDDVFRVAVAGINANGPGLIYWLRITNSRINIKG